MDSVRPSRKGELEREKRGSGFGHNTKRLQLLGWGFDKRKENTGGSLSGYLSHQELFAAAGRKSIKRRCEISWERMRGKK